MLHDEDSLVNDLEALGVNKGDVLLVRADLGKVGKVKGRIGETIINALLTAVGIEGTIIALSFTKTFLLQKIDKKYVFDNNTVPITGALAKLFLKHPSSIRSRHPSNSFVAIGRYASELLEGHDENSLSFSPIEKLLQLNGKMILIGCVDTSPGFTTVHYAQQKLGLTSRNLLSNKIGVYFERNSQIKLFKRKDFGGCSKGFYKFYSYYINNKKLKSGRFGNANTIVIESNDAFNIEYEILKKNPRFALCDIPDCLSCRGTVLYNKRDMPLFYLKYFPLVIKKMYLRPVKK
jgi:aminoglycoside N3'-acetyltransferase